MADILNFTGITRLDTPPDRVLDAALGKLTEVVVVGYDQEGNEYFASSKANGADALWLLERGKHRLMQIVDNMTD